MKIALCIPSRNPKPKFVLALAELISWSLAQEVRVDGQLVKPSIAPLVAENMTVEQAREKLVENALQWEPSHLLFVDDDMTFPPHSLYRLMSHFKDVVGCNYPRRGGDHLPTASIGEGETWQRVAPKSEGLQPVDALGFGLVLIKAEVFRSIPRPWFQQGPHGEDGYFCLQAKAHGIQPYVDHSLSMEVGHIAETVLRF